MPKDIPDSASRSVKICPDTSATPGIFLISSNLASESGLLANMPPAASADTVTLSE